MEPIQRHVHTVFCDMWSTLDYMQEGYISQRDADIFQVVDCSDDAFAGSVDTALSISGGQVCLNGPSFHLPIHSLAKRPGSTASSTPEADMVAADAMVQTMLSPSLEIWETWMQRWIKDIRGILREDNEAATRAIQSGRNPTMMHPHRAHGLSIASLHG